MARRGVDLRRLVAWEQRRGGGDPALPFQEGFRGIRGDALRDDGGGPRAADFQEETRWVGGGETHADSRVRATYRTATSGAGPCGTAVTVAFHLARELL